MTESYSVTLSNFYKSPKQPHGKLERNRVSSPGDTSFRIGLGLQRSESPIQTGLEEVGQHIFKNSNVIIGRQLFLKKELASLTSALKPF